MQHAQTPDQIPKTASSLRTLMRCQITTFPYENLSVHYSPTHLVNIHPQALYDKMMGPENGGRGGYCMELSIFFYHILCGIGFEVYMTGVRNRTRTNGVPGGTYQGWTHINNVVHLPSGERFSIDVAFGGDGPTNPLPMNESATPMRNLGTQEVRLVHDLMPKQHQRSAENKVWIYQYRNGPDKEWNSFYSFAEIEFFQEDFEVMNWWGSANTLHRWTVLVVRFLRRDEPILFEESASRRRGGASAVDEGDVEVTGKLMLVNDTIKVNLGGRTTVVETFDTEESRLKALRDYFGIQLTKEQEESIRGWNMALG